MIFPPFVAFSGQIQGTELYMTCIPDGNKQAGFLEFNRAAEVPSSIARFVVERVPNSDLVHIRSCYKNKYLCRTTTSGSYITAVGSSEPVEDKRAVNCTLFRVKDLGSRIATLTHVQSGYEVSGYPDQSLSPRVVIGTKALSLKIVDYGLLTTLPKRVIFKGDNGQYLRCRRQKPWPIVTTFGVVEEEYHEYNEFTSNDGSDRSSHYEIIPYNGIIRVKSLEYGKFLRRNDHRTYNSWIWGDSDDTTINNLDTLFVVENVGSNVVALRNLGNNKVCRLLREEDRLRNCFRATETYVVAEARLVVEEPVSKRLVMAKYRLDDARITSQTLEYHSTVEEANKYNNRDGVIELSIKYKKTRDTKWSKTTTHTNNSNAKIDIELPKFVKGQISIDGKIEDVKQFEDGSHSSIEVTARCEEKVPPMTKVILKGYILKVTYDVPCSYIESIVYTTGEKETIVVEDGVCQGLEAHGCHFEKEYIKLS